MTQESRRQVLSTLGATAVGTLLAGCSGLTGSGPAETDGNGTGANGTETDEFGTDSDANGTEAPTETDRNGNVPLVVPPSEMDEPSRAIAEAPVPSDPPTYPLTGATGAPVTATLYGSWKCVHTEDLVSDHFVGLLEDYVLPGDLAIEFRDLAYWESEGYLGEEAPNAGHAGQAVWNEAPADFWRYFGTVMANQPSEDEPWSTSAQLVAFAEFAETDAIDAIRTAIEDEQYEAPLRKTTAVVEELALNGIPRVVVDGTVTIPTENPQGMYDAIENATSG